MNSERREYLKRLAQYAAERIPNGPTAGDFRKAATGQNEDILKAIDLVLHHDHELGER